MSSGKARSAWFAIALFVSFGRRGGTLSLVCGHAMTGKAIEMCISHSTRGAVRLSTFPIRARARTHARTQARTRVCLV